MDTSDGLFSGRERERKLEIMKDSRIGSFGVVAFVFVTLLKWQLLTAIPTAEFIPMALIMMPLMSRWSLVLSIRSYPYARKEGMGAAFANLAPKHVITYNTISTFFMPIVILIIGAILYTLLYGAYSIFSAADVGYVVGLGVLVYATLGIFQINIVSMIITYIINRLLNRYIVKQLGGTTGDTYGFVVEVTEVLLLFVYIIILSILSATVASNTTMF